MRMLRARSPRIALALALAALLVACGGDASPRLEASSDVELCQKQLARIYAGLLEYQAKFGHAPQHSGVRFLGALISDGIWPNTAANARVLSCPGVEAASLCGGARPEQWYADPAKLSGECSAYAARDSARAPLPSFPTSGREALVACDCAHGMNHARYANVLCADGSIVTLDIEKLKREGVLPPEATRIPIGPDAPEQILEGALRALSQD